jgi:hypothetical protein
MNSGELAKTIQTRVIFDSELISAEESYPLLIHFNSRQQITAAEILELDLPAKNRVDALLQYEFFGARQLRDLACDFIEHTLHIFEERSTGEHRPRRCVEVARLPLKGSEREKLQRTIEEAIPIVWQLAGTEFVGAFEAGLAATFLNYEDAAEMTRLVARHTQRAAHRKLWESRKSNLQPMTGREKEATWQLKRIVEMLI